MRWLARLALAGFGAAAAISIAAALGARLGLFTRAFGMNLLVPVAAAAAVGFGAGLAWLVISLRENRAPGARAGLIGLAGAGAILALSSYYLEKEIVSPPIHDISTDVEYAPPFKTLLAARTGAPNGASYDGPDEVRLGGGKRMSVAALQKKYYGDVIPFAQFIKPRKLFWRALNLANRMGWHVIDFNADEGRIEATDTTLWFGYTDDIIIRIRPAGKLGARLDIRSKSREGNSDFGRNAARLRQFLKQLKEMS
ncbi:MAG: DUF1499 domain-containing protein [Alphaproteobacteria bacterium]|nr:DUF1499 domain-containing protein [Alphaproteobacteria bacterium]